MRKLRLGIDLDGVVADFVSGWTRRYNDHFGAALAPEHVTTWDAAPLLTHFERMGDFWRWASSGERTLFRDLPTYAGAMDALRALGRHHDLVVVTTKPSWAIPDTFAWLADVAFPTREVHITGDKASVACDVYLDDGPHNLEALAAGRPETTICRYVRPWNEPVPGCIDVASWAEFSAVVDGVARR